MANGTAEYEYTTITEICSGGTVVYDIQEQYDDTVVRDYCYSISAYPDDGYEWSSTKVESSHGTSKGTWSPNVQSWSSTSPQYLTGGNIETIKKEGGINIVITVTFTKKPLATYTVTVTPSPLNGGTVSGGGTYTEGTVCTITATAKSGYRFLRWEGLSTETTSTYSFGVYENSSWTAYFHKNTGLILRHKDSGKILRSSGNVILRDGNP